MERLPERTTVANVRVGKPETKPDAPSHTRGVREGNDPPRRKREVGARRSTGIRAEVHGPIDPRMPVLSPA
jgi:hypothetical protein